MEEIGENLLNRLNFTQIPKMIYTNTAWVCTWTNSQMMKSESTLFLFLIPLRREWGGSSEARAWSNQRRLRKCSAWILSFSANHWSDTTNQTKNPDRQTKRAIARTTPPVPMSWSLVHESKFGPGLQTGSISQNPRLPALWPQPPPKPLGKFSSSYPS